MSNAVLKSIKTHLKSKLEYSFLRVPLHEKVTASLVDLLTQKSIGDRPSDCAQFFQQFLKLRGKLILGSNFQIDR